MAADLTEGNVHYHPSRAEVFTHNEKWRLIVDTLQKQVLLLWILYRNKHYYCGSFTETSIIIVDPLQKQILSLWTLYKSRYYYRHFIEAGIIDILPKHLFLSAIVHYASKVLLIIQFCGFVR